MKTIHLACASMMVVAASSFGNDIQVANVSMSSRDTLNKTTQVSLDVSWENSWRDLINHDAAWIFVKYRTSGGTGDGVWRHATLSSTGHSAPSGGQIASTSDNKGALLSRSATGSGSFSCTGVQIRWNYGVDLESTTPSDFVDDADIVELQAFAIEMVYVPQAAFYVGDGNTGAGFSIFHRADSTATPFQVTSENAITLGGTSSSNLGATLPGSSLDDFSAGVTQTLPAGFPKGYAPFYSMKCELSQKQYVDFLNTLERTQQNNRVRSITANQYALTNNVAVIERNGVRCPATIPPSAPVTFGCDFNNNGTFNEAGDGLGIACSYLLWADLAAYLDWACLRPMSELEYEKSCRGDLAPVIGEYASGSTSNGSFGALLNSGTSTEQVNTAFYAANFNSGGPHRVGRPATSTSTRVEAGAGYYGALDLCGNVIDYVVGVGTSAGRSFTAVSGNGSLDANGDADAATWPGPSGTGGGARGGAYGVPSIGFVTCRELANEVGVSATAQGGRGVRSYP